MKIIFMGSADFAVPSLSALIEAGHDIVTVVTQPDKPAGRGYNTTACPAAKYAQENNLFLYQPNSLKKTETIEHLRKLGAELFVVVAYGKILPKAALDIPPHGCVNVHGSLLPKYRGAAPINWAIVNGDTETGVTTMFMDEGMDSGDILQFCSTPIDECETAQNLHDRLATVGAEILIETIEKIEANEIERIPQNDKIATFAPILKREDGRIDWTQAAGAIYNRIRGLSPWPGAFTFIKNKRLQIHEAAIVDENSNAKPGTVIGNEDAIVVACGKGQLYLLELQLEGKKRMSAQDFLRGNSISEDTILG